MPQTRSLPRRTTALQLPPPHTLLNDIHSQMNPTLVSSLVAVSRLGDLTSALFRAAQQNFPVSISGGRHAMGGQQFRTAGLHLDLTPCERVLSFDAENGIIEVEAGIRWPALIRWLNENQSGVTRPWVIRQKQTGADRLSTGGALAANIHGRGLHMRPIIGDVESFLLVDANGAARHCSRTENRDLFRLAIGGYGLFGVIYSVRLRLMRCCNLRRVVELRTTDGLIDAFERRSAEGCVFGDFQFAIDAQSDDFLQRGVFSCYRPVSEGRRPTDSPHQLTRENWLHLLCLAHTNKSLAFATYAGHYLATNGQIYPSDTLQLSPYLDDYHAEIDRRCGARCPGHEMITELYVPRQRLEEFLGLARETLRRRNANVIYGTIRLIERDDESFLAWARESYACIVLNLHVDYTPPAQAAAADAFRALIDCAIACHGSYYLTYHRFARRDQVLACHPRFPEFMRRKRQFDPASRFQSDWYAHFVEMFE